MDQKSGLAVGGNRRVRKAPINCPSCKRSSGRRNGRRQLLNKGLSQQFHCKDCGHQWLISDSVDPYFQNLRMRIPVEKIFKGAGLLVLGTRLSEICWLKSETLQFHLERLLRHRGWNHLESILIALYDLPGDYLMLFGWSIEAWLSGNLGSASISKLEA